MSSSGNMKIDVVASIIPQNNKILLCQRSVHSVHPLEWEFPGGKIGHDESPEDALARELREELCLEVMESEQIYLGNHEYPQEGFSVILRFYITRVRSLNYKNLIFNNVEFVPLNMIEKKNLLAADRKFWPYILKFIKSGNLLYRFNNGG